MEKKEEILRVRNLDISFETTAGMVNAVRGVNLTVNRGETVAIVGESGSGKSVSAKAIMGILAKNGTIDRGQITFSYYRNPEERVTREILQMKKEEIRRHINGKRIAMVFQDPMTSLNPTYTIGHQLMEAITLHTDRNRKQAWDRAVEMLRLVNVNEPEKRMKQYPYEFSGGMRQRVMIAMALACEPDILIADEPTTALDVTIQAQILDLMKSLQKELGKAIILITHDLGVINQMADNVAVMYCGQVVEYAPAETIFHKNEYSHPYTEGLMLSIPRLDTPSDERLEAIPGAVPHPLDLPKGCKFAPRCKYATERCLEEEPELIRVSDTQQVRCFYAKKEDRHAK